MKIVSWNVNGIRSAEKEVISFLENFQPDILFLQELRAHPNDLNFFLKMVSEYEVKFNPAKRAGYSGTAVYYRKKVNGQVFNQVGSDILDREGRTMKIKMGNVILFNLYVPNGNASSQRLQYKLEFLKELSTVSKALINKDKFVVIGADMNVARTKKDTYRPETAKRSSGFLPVERELFKELLEVGLIDSFRLFEKEGGHYTWWSFDDKDRMKNHGWRFDYFLVSENLVPKVKHSEIMKDVYGSDHCPIILEIEE